jgi:hypothetical protein
MPVVVPCTTMFTPGSGPSASDVTLPLIVFPCAQAKLIAKPKRRSVRMPLLHKKTKFRKFAIVGFF